MRANCVKQRPRFQFSPSPGRGSRPPPTEVGRAYTVPLPRHSFPGERERPLCQLCLPVPERGVSSRCPVSLFAPGYPGERPDLLPYRAHWPSQVLPRSHEAPGPVPESSALLCYTHEWTRTSTGRYISARRAPPAACFAPFPPVLVLTARRGPPAGSHAPAPGAPATCPARLLVEKAVLPRPAAGSTRHGPGAWPPTLRSWRVALARTRAASATSRSVSPLRPAPLVAAGSYPPEKPSLPAYLLPIPLAPCRLLRRLPDSNHPQRQRGGGRVFVPRARAGHSSRQARHATSAAGPANRERLLRGQRDPALGGRAASAARNASRGRRPVRWRAAAHPGEHRWRLLRAHWRWSPRNLASWPALAR